MTPYYEKDGITIYHGDCRELISVIGGGAVDLILTDPPYGVRYVTARRSHTDKLRKPVLQTMIHSKRFERRGRCAWND